MKIEMLTDRPEHWTDGPLKGKGVVRNTGVEFTVGEDDLEKVQKANADLWITRSWAKKATKGTVPANTVIGENDVN